MILLFIPSIWLWLDELYYFSTAFDIAHWGEAGVPHPGFFFYPPLTSLLLAPLHALPVSAPTTYQLSVILLNVLLSLTILIGYLIHYNFFAERSYTVPLLLTFAAPSYTALMLMSEPLFIILYSAFFLLLICYLHRESRIALLLAAILLPLLALTRQIGVCVTLALLPLLPLHAHYSKTTAFRRPRLFHYAALLLPTLILLPLWHSLLRPFLTTSHGPLGVAQYLSSAAPLILASPERLGHFATKVLAEIAYVNLSTLGFPLPLLLWYLFRHRASTSRDISLKLGAVTLFAFMALAALAAAVHMTITETASSLPRYQMYGRYMEYFAIPLFAISMGLLGRLRPLNKTARQEALLMTVFLNGMLLLAVPTQFYNASLHNQIAPNSLGLALLLRIYDFCGPLIVPLLLPLVLVLTFLLISPSVTRRMRGIVIACLLLTVIANYSVALMEVSRNSRGADRHSGIYSRYVIENISYFRSGLYVDFRHEGEFAGKNSLAFKVVADHLPIVIAGNEPITYVDTYCVMTKVEIPGAKLLYKHPRLDYRIYAPLLDNAGSP